MTADYVTFVHEKYVHIMAALSAIVSWFNSTCMEFMPWISNYTQINYKM